MDIKIGRILIWACLILLIACSKDYELRPCSLYITDSKPCTDSLAEIRKNSYNARTLDLQFVIKNNTGKSLCIPIKTVNPSNISVCLTNEQDTIIPKFTVKKVPYNTNIINEGDSIRLFVKLYRFPDWQSDWCNVNTDVKQIISMLRISYHGGDCSDTSTDKVVLKFDEIQSNYTLYVIPPGAIIDEM